MHLSFLRSAGLLDYDETAAASAPPVSARTVTHLTGQQWDHVDPGEALALAVPLIDVMADTVDYAPTARRLGYGLSSIANAMAASIGRPAEVQAAHRNAIDDQVHELHSLPVPASMQRAVSEILETIDALPQRSAAPASSGSQQALGTALTALGQFLRSIAAAVGIG